MKEYDNAIEYYKKAIAADPEYAEAYSNVGLVYLMKAQIMQIKQQQISMILNTLKLRRWLRNSMKKQSPSMKKLEL